MKFHRDLMFAHLKVDSREELLKIMADAVRAEGFASDDYYQALLDREAEFPTALPVPGGVAIPHTSAQYVSTNTIAVATLDTPVQFHEMGADPDSLIDVTVVFLLVLSDGTQHVTLLSQLIAKIQSDDFLGQIKTAKTADAIVSVLDSHFNVFD